MLSPWLGLLFLDKNPTELITDVTIQRCCVQHRLICRAFILSIKFTHLTRFP